MDKIKDFFSVLRTTPVWVERNKTSFSRTVVSLILCGASLAMLIMNLKNNSMVMAAASFVLVVGFVLSAVVSGVFKKPLLAGYIISLLVCFVLSLFAVSGGNEGFAILWVLLVPLFAVSLLGINEGVSVATFFLVFLFLLFYTPLNQYIEGKYSESFISRFPVLYACDYLISIFLSVQKEYFYKKAHIQLYTDSLTGTYNRRFFMEKVEKLNAGSHYGIMMIDVNGLKRANDTLGHKAGDELICAVPQCFRQVFGDDVSLCRMGGDEFALIVHDTDERVRENIGKLRDAAAQWKGKYCSEVSFSIGWASTAKFPLYSYAELMTQADKEMYIDKSEYYKTHDRRNR